MYNAWLEMRPCALLELCGPLLQAEIDSNLLGHNARPSIRVSQAVQICSSCLPGHVLAFEWSHNETSIV